MPAASFSAATALWKTAAAAVVASAASTVAWSTTEFENDDSGPFILAIILMSSTSGPNTAASGFPVAPRDAWSPFVVPAVYLLANGLWSQPLARFLKAALLNTFLLLVMAAFGCWNVLKRERAGRQHFFTVRDIHIITVLLNVAE